jgi:hypothetical protein
MAVHGAYPVLLSLATPDAASYFIDLIAIDLIASRGLPHVISANPRVPDRPQESSFDGPRTS